MSLAGQMPEMESGGKNPILMDGVLQTVEKNAQPKVSEGGDV